MLNQVIVVGRLTKEVELKEIGEKKVANVTIAVPRSFKNADGEYETDFINCVLWDGVANNTAEYCHKGDIVGIKGRLQNKPMANDDGEIVAQTTQVIAEKVTFLSQSKKNDVEGNGEE